MLGKLINAKLQMFYVSIQKWINQRRQYQVSEANKRHEQYVSILQKRYGYTRQKATEELEKHYTKVRFY